MDSGARDAANAYFELRDRGEENQPAFEAALSVYCSHFPSTKGFAVGHDRIIFITKDTDFSGMTFEIFRDLKDAMTKVFLKDMELNPSNFSAYRVAVVSSPSINQIMMQLFGTIWKTDPNPIVAVERFELISDALVWLGRETIPESDFRDELIGV